MNKRDRQQLKASIAKDLIQGQGEHTATRELLKQYAPLEGVITTPAGGTSQRPRPAPPVEKNLAHNATVAPERNSPWHSATEAPPATVPPDATLALLATVKGELRVPNTLNFSLFPTLDPFAKAVYYQLYLLSHGFRRDTCVVGLAKLAKSVTRRTPAKINSLNYFVKEILATPDGRNHAWQKKRLEKIIVRIRDCSVGRSEYSNIDFLEDVKCACVREGVVFNDDIYNELVE
jgi:hypothetical protein